MKTYRFLSLPLLMLMLTAGALAQPYDRLPAPGDTPPPPMPPTVPPGFNFGPLSRPTPTLWIWGGYDGTTPTARKFIQPSIGLELYGSNRASRGRTEWGIAEFPMQFSSFADPQDAVLMAEEGEDLIFTVRHNFLNYPCGHAGNNPYAHPTSHGSIRFGTKHHVCVPPNPLDPNLPDTSSPEYMLFQHDLERMTIQSNGMVGIHVPEPQRTLHVSNRWGHEAAIRISNDQYSGQYLHLNEHVATLGIAELAVPSAGGLFSTLADANDFVIRTAGGTGNPESDIILTAHNAGASIRMATAETTSQEEERLTVQNGGDVTIGGSVGIGFLPDQSLLSDPVNWQQQRKLDVRGGQVGISPPADESGVLTITPSKNGNWWNMANIMNGGMLAFMPGDMLTNVPGEVDGNGDLDPALVKTTWANAPMVISSDNVVGIGTLEPDMYSALHVHNKPIRLSKNGTNTRLQVAIATNNGDYSSAATPGDLIMRMVDGTATEDLIIASSNPGASLKFATRSASDGDNIERVRIEGDGSLTVLNDQQNPLFYVGADGFVGIGTNVACPTTPPSYWTEEYKLGVDGMIKAKEVIITTESIEWCDYVFDEDYQLMDLTSLETFINEKRHLPEVPSAAEVDDRGIVIGEMQAVLLKKIEEMTLHLIAQNKRVSELEEEIRQLRRHSPALDSSQPGNE